MRGPRRTAIFIAVVCVLTGTAGAAQAATFGKTTTGGASTYASVDYKLVSKFSLGESGTVSKLTASLSGSGTSGFQNLRGILYADSGGVPGALKGTTQEVSVTYNAARSWVDFTFANPVTLSAGDYWLGLHAGPRFGDALTYYGYDAAIAFQRTLYDPYSDGASDPFGTGASKDRLMAVYATYTSGAAATPPTMSVPPAISGSAQEGQTLTASSGTWSGTPPIAYAYRWQSCDSSGAACADIASATGSAYLVAAADVGKTIRVRVTASNSAGSNSATSAQTGVVAAKPASDPVIAAAGDIACDPVAWNYNGGLGTSTACRQKAVSDLLVNGGYSAVLPLGDEQYECAPLAALQQAYDPSWGRLKAISHPVVGNHEYYRDADLSGTTHTACDTSTRPADSYFTYFGSSAGDPARGYYSYDIGTWHLIALNSNCSKIGGCGAGSAEEQWLRADLAAHPATCTLAYWHHPLFNSDGTGQATGVQALWQALYDSSAELVLSGHAHDYERFAPQTSAGALDAARGIREIVAGTGGKSHSSWLKDAYGNPVFKPNSEVHDNTTFGVLQLTLHPSGYDWKFVPEAGKTFTDSGSTACH